MTRRIIRTDGTEVLLHNSVSYHDVLRLIDATAVDAVSLHHLGNPRQVMLVDDHGYETEMVEHAPGHIELRPTRALKLINYKATELYLANCKPGTEHHIVGDVIVAFDSDFA